MRRLILLLAAAALLGSTVPTVDAGAVSPRAKAKKVRLARFASCKRLVSYARHYAPRERRYAGGPVVAPGVTPLSRNPGPVTAAPDAAPHPSDSSQTNNLASGVCASDLVMTDAT